jgi:hypothetical protein
VSSPAPVTGADTTGLTVALGVITGVFTTSPAKLDVALANTIGKAMAKLQFAFSYEFWCILFLITVVFIIGKATIAPDEVTFLVGD